ncbi:hypothetical protein [Streptomyces sp. NPDC005805]|uniref:hypothetical protein n=1 Tax=Streptomyces sp. NPDC005805 TaxID=3157068 RepID=UPI0033F38563
MTSGGRRRAKAAAAIVTGALLATGIALYTTDSGPFRDSYCWDGAWQQNSGPAFLGDEILDDGASERREARSEAPTREKPRGTCVVEVRGDAERTVTVDYGPPPEDTTARKRWLFYFLHGTVTPLPDGLDGAVAEDRGLVVLPAACDTDAGPTVVTLRTTEWDGDRVSSSPGFGGPTTTRELLLAAANAGARAAGCAPERALAGRAPFVSVPGDLGETMLGKELCAIPGVTFDWPRGSRYREYRGAVGDRLQTCSLSWPLDGGEHEPSAHYVMTAAPRLNALFAGLPEGRDQGLVRVACGDDDRDGDGGDREAVFYGAPGVGVQGRAEPDVRGVFDAYVKAVGTRIGCGGAAAAAGGERA